LDRTIFNYSFVNQITLQVGAQLTKDGTGGDIAVAIFENDVASAVVVAPYSVTKAGSDYDPSTVNVTTDGFIAYMVENDTTTVRPGVSMFYTIGIVIPPYQTGKVEVSFIIIKIN